MGLLGPNIQVGVFDVLDLAAIGAASCAWYACTDGDRVLKKSSDDDARHLFLSDRYALFIGGISDTTVHAHYLVQLSLALGGPFELWSESDWQECSAAIVPSNVPHALRVKDASIVLLYLDPTTTEGAQVAARCEGNRIRAYQADEIGNAVTDARRYLQTGYDQDVAEAVFQRLFDALTPGSAAPPSIDPRIREVLMLLNEADADSWHLPRLAARVDLSSDRLRHLFREQLGISIRSYKTWARVRRAMTLLAHGGSLTEVAHAANFADAAHLSRAFRDMFGITPSELAQSHIELH